MSITLRAAGLNDVRFLAAHSTCFPARLTNPIAEPIMNRNRFFSAGPKFMSPTFIAPRTLRFFALIVLTLGTAVPTRSSLGEVSPTQAQATDIAPFLYLPFRGDWVLNMNSGFDHDYPDYNAHLAQRRQVDPNYTKKILMYQALWDPNNTNRRDYAGANFGCQPVDCPESTGSTVGYYWPTYEFYIWYDGHDGYDFGPGKADGSTGSAYDVLAAAGGTITFVGWSCDAKYGSDECSKIVTVNRGGKSVTGPRREFDGFGYRMDIEHDVNGDGQTDYMTRYGHLVANSNTRALHQTVSAGEVIATIGTTGNSTGNHLHFGVFHRSGSSWAVTDPFGWDMTSPPSQRTPDPLVSFNGESSQNLWVDGSPRWIGASLGQALTSLPPNTRPLGGNPDGMLPLVVPVSDTVAPTGAFSAPAPGSTLTSANVSLSATAADNAGGSGVREVRFSAKWNNAWHGIGVAYAAPYLIAWDLCAASVPDGDIELGLEVWDNAGNKWVYSEHATNPHVIKQYLCGNSPASSNWEIDYWLNTFLAGTVNAHSSDSATYLFKDWNGATPVGGIGATDWSARFTTTRYFQGGHYDVYADGDDGVRIRIDGEAGDPNWWNSSVRGYNLAPGNHSVVIEYRQTSGNSKLQAFWRGPGALPVVSQDPTQWFAQYYPNRDLWGEAPLLLNEGGGFLYRQWDLNGPGWGLPSDNFSARYRRTVEFACGTYQFDLFADDGARVKIDGTTVPGLDQWHDGVNGYTANVSIGAGSHEIAVEHYDNGGSAAVQLSWALLSACKPDLQPLPVVPASVQGTTSTDTLYADTRTFLDWRFLNADPGGAINTNFFVELWIDDLQLARYPFSGLGGGQSTGFADWAETIPDPGWHTLRLIVDPDQLVAETSEDNNIWQTAFYWQPVAGWKGEYFQNTTLDGNPWMTRDDTTLNFDWLANAPDPALPNDGFSARWIREVDFEGGIYRFDFFHDDGARLVVDGKAVLEDWCGDCRHTSQVEVLLAPGPHHLRAEMWENTGWAGARLDWVKVRDLQKVYLPSLSRIP